VTNFYIRLGRQKIQKITHGIVDSLRPFIKTWWEFPGGYWEVRADGLYQTNSEIPGAYALNWFLVSKDVDFMVWTKPTLVDSTYRLIGLCVREIQRLTHYFAGIYYNDTEAKQRIYKQYSELAKVFTGASYCRVGMAICGKAIINYQPEILVRGLTSGYEVKFYFTDGTSDSVKVPPGETYITYVPNKPTYKIEVYDSVGNLITTYKDLVGGFDDYVLGGPGTYVLLADASISYNYDWVKQQLKAKGDTIIHFVGLNKLIAIDTEFIAKSPHGLRMYETTGVYRNYIRVG